MHIHYSASVNYLLFCTLYCRTRASKMKNLKKSSCCVSVHVSIQCAGTSGRKFGQRLVGLADD